MNITYFFRNYNPKGPSIENSFAPFISNISKQHHVEVYYVPYAGSNPINILKNIWFIHKNSCKDGINHVTGDIHYGILGLLGRVSVLTIHDDAAIRAAHRGIYDKIYKWLFWIFLPILLSDDVWCISPSTLNDIKRYYNSKKLHVVTHHSFSPSFHYVKHVFNDACPRILHIGTTERKNLEATLMALKGICCKLVVLKEMTPKQHKLANELHIDYENFYGIPENDVVKLYESSDIVVLPSSFEGFGMPIVEAQIVGIPVVTTNMEPMNWVAGDGAVLLENPNNIEEYKKVIRHLIEDGALRDRIIEKGRTNSLRFSIERATQQCCTTYEKILNGKGII